MFILSSKFKLLLTFCTGIVLLASCRKEKATNPARENQDYEQLTLKLTESLPAAQIDSVVFAFSQNGNTLYKKSAITGNKAVLKSTQVPAGIWSVQALVYTKKLADNSYRMYRNAATTLQNQQTLITTGPTGQQWGDGWMPAVMLKEAKYGITLIMAERPDDPYLEIRFPTNLQGLQGAAVDRVLWKNGLNDGEDYLSMYMNQSALAQRRFVDNEYFKSYCNRIKNKDWDEMDFTLQVYTTLLPGPNSELLFHYVVPKRP